MPKLKWDFWYRSDGCRHHMSKTRFAGVDYGTVFWRAMRAVFIDEHDNYGLLYNGKLYPQVKKVVAKNGRRYGFNEEQEKRMLREGEFRYPIATSIPTLLYLWFEGPDIPEDNRNWASAYCPGRHINVNFYNMRDFAKKHFPKTKKGVEQLVYFTGAVVLHEIMHNHGFSHPKKVNWKPGTDYASSLPHVAFWSVLRASPHWSHFKTVFTGLSLAELKMCGCRTIS